MSVTVSVLAHSDFGAERPAAPGTWLRDWARTVEDSGLDGIFVPTEIGWHRYDPLALLGALAAWTDRVTLGTCVLLAPLHDPLRLAEATATLQHVSGGRVVLGLGMGWRQAEFDAAGIPLSERLPRTLEHLRALRRLLRGEVLEAAGRHYAFDGVQVGLAEGLAPTPLWLGAHGAPGIARAAREADAWIAGPFATLAGLERQVAVYTEALAAAGRSPERLAVMRECHVAEDSAQAWEEAEPLRAKYQEYARRVGRMPFDADAPLRDLAAGRFVVGDADECAQALAEIVSRSGATDLILRTQFRGTDLDTALRGIRLLGTEVVPRLRRLLPAEPDPSDARAASQP